MLLDPVSSSAKKNRKKTYSGREEAIERYWSK
jgi:hypothetical protein